MLSIPFIVVVKCNKVPKFNKISIFYFIFLWKEKMVSLSTMYL